MQEVNSVAGQSEHDYASDDNDNVSLYHVTTSGSFDQDEKEPKGQMLLLFTLILS